MRFGSPRHLETSNFQLQKLQEIKFPLTVKDQETKNHAHNQVNNPIKKCIQLTKNNPSQNSTAIKTVFTRTRTQTTWPPHLILKNMLVEVSSN